MIGGSLAYCILGGKSAACHTNQANFLLTSFAERDMITVNSHLSLIYLTTLPLTFLVPYEEEFPEGAPTITLRESSPALRVFHLRIFLDP